jgi:signal transduction histidine kinase
MPVTTDSSSKAVAVLLTQLDSIEKLERHIQRLDRLANIGTLSASMAHEIKNALVPVKTFVDLLLEKNPNAELAGTVRREMSRMDAIIYRLLKPAAAAKPEFCTVHLHELLEHSLRVVQHRTEGKSIAFDSKLAASPDTLEGNDQLLEQAFLNLLLNAVEAIESQGHLRVQTEIVTEDARLPQRLAEAAPRFLRVQIIDSGVGILPENIHSIFDPFFTTKESGTGLGLAVTRGIIEDHSGIIGVESKPRHGTTFTVLLPTSATESKVAS